ncbi:MAG: hypothetical protein LBD82_00870 [Deltaproteobacteria bacterium]|jgi:hypothetical protein|nr:hypothetical protein [Deltaproteobacteria bacterium]
MRITRIAAIFLCLAWQSSPAQAENAMSKAAAAMGREINRQIAERFGQQEGPINGISLIVTTPVDLNNLEDSNPVARQMQEELSSWFVQTGYSVREVRQGKALLMRPSAGELLLTRNKDLIPFNEARSALTLVGTYTLTSRSIIFNIRLLRTGGSEVCAMSNVSLPVNGELRSMISVNAHYGGTSSSLSSPSSITGQTIDYLIEPSVFSRLP